jgi:hypothetical protein
VTVRTPRWRASISPSVCREQHIPSYHPVDSPADSSSPVASRARLATGWFYLRVPVCISSSGPALYVGRRPARIARRTRRKHGPSVQHVPGFHSGDTRRRFRSWSITATTYWLWSEHATHHGDGTVRLLRNDQRVRGPLAYLVVLSRAGAAADRRAGLKRIAYRLNVRIRRASSGRQAPGLRAALYRPGGTDSYRGGGTSRVFGRLDHGAASRFGYVAVVTVRHGDPRMQLRRSLSAAAVTVIVIVQALAGVIPRSANAAPRPSRAVLAVGNSYDGTVTLIDAHTLKRLGSPLNVIPDGDTPRDPTQAAVYPTIIASRGEVNYTQDIACPPTAASSMYRVATSAM